MTNLTTRHGNKAPPNQFDCLKTSPLHQLVFSISRISRPCLYATRYIYSCSTRSRATNTYCAHAQKPKGCCILFYLDTPGCPTLMGANLAVAILFYFIALFFGSVDFESAVQRAFDFLASSCCQISFLCHFRVFHIAGSGLGRRLGLGVFSSWKWQCADVPVAVGLVRF